MSAPTYTGDSHKEPLGHSAWTLTILADRVSASRKVWGRPEHRSIPFHHISTVAAQKGNLVINYTNGELVICGLGRKVVGDAQAQLLSAINMARQQSVAPAAMPAINVTVQAPPTPHTHRLSECPRCGADLAPQMKKCPYCSKPLV